MVVQQKGLSPYFYDKSKEPVAHVPRLRLIDTEEGLSRMESPYRSQLAIPDRNKSL